ncbi:MAG: TIR domain-containing protein [Acidobacteriaceae bacterium]|nr:TIR domain-containing protein [Acidobacteriaceae bacterium]
MSTPADAISAPKAFISYSHDSIDGEDRVLQLANRLREEGVDVMIDQYLEGGPGTSIARWTEQQICNSDFVLVVCNKAYLDRLEQKLTVDEAAYGGRGVVWEANIIYNLLYASRGDTTKFVPVLFDRSEERYIPTPLRGLKYYVLESDGDYEDLVRHFYGIPRSLKPELIASKRDRPNLPAKQARSFPSSLGLVSGRASEAERLRMIQRVRNDWIYGVLDHSLYKRARIELELQLQPAAVTDPRLLRQRIEQEPDELPPGTHLRTVFDDSGGGLLILGDPGAGKTTLLLELARDLLDAAEHDRNLPVPVVFTLSTWTAEKGGFEAWLVNQLNEINDVPRNTAQSWVRGEQILPLLDGLDEVPVANRRACVDAINAYRRDHGLLPIVIASRIADYRALGVRLRVPTAVLIQPLTFGDIQRFLNQPVPAFRRLLHAMENDELLADLLQSPLMLSIALLVYREDDDSREQSAGTTEERRTRLLERYVDIMLQKRGDAYPKDKTIKWLSWLASQMQSRSEVVFSLESLSPKWLGQPARTLIPIFTVAGAAMLAFTIYAFLLLVACPFVLFIAPRYADVPMLAMHFGLLPIPLLALGLIIYLFQRRADLAPAESLQWKTASAWTVLGSWSIYRYILWTFAMIQLFFLGLVSISWFFVQIPQHALDPEPNATSTWTDIFEGLIGAVAAGFSISFVEKSLRVQQPERVAPNAGTHRSARNALSIGILTAIPIGSIFALMSYFRLIGQGAPKWFAFGTALLYFAISGYWVGSIIGLIRGGLFSIQHVITRFALWMSGTVPLRYVRFLNCAADCLILRRVGGGYSFIHRIVLEYFVSLRLAKAK